MYIVNDDEKKEYNGLDSLASVSFQSYKSFSNNEQVEIPMLSKATLIIGRNNCGKSSLIDVISTSVSSKKQLDGLSNLQLGFRLDAQHIERGFSKGARALDGIMNRYGSCFEYGKQFINRILYLEYDENRNQYIVSNNQSQINLIAETRSSWENVAHSYNSELSSVCIRRVNAERDIIPEEENDFEAVSINGDGATNLIRKFINNDSYDETIVESVILRELNKIMEPESHFSSIRVQQVSTDEKSKYRWEVFLEEYGQRFALSKSGSGLKTILLILINLYLVPKTKEYKEKEIVYAFEEIENNLHPALQRRVFEYLYHYAERHNTRIFLTSHSHIAINTFFGKEHANLYHVVKEAGISSLLPIGNSKERSEILDDLDVKASDIFQSNGIIWVEGPSDRIYILRWLQTFTDFRFVEGQHFQFMYYGGRLLSHYTAGEFEEKTDNLINILTMNRNAVMVIDSDKRNVHARINDTKRRVRDELKGKGLFCWVTKGKEIENYISAEAVNNAFGSNLKQIEPFELFPDYIEKYDKNFASHKVETARKLSKFITSDNSEDILDLSENIGRLKDEIEKWNQ